MADTAVISIGKDPRVWQSCRQQILRPKDVILYCCSVGRVGADESTELGGALAAVVDRRWSAVLEPFASICPGASRVAGKAMHEDNTI